MTDWKTVKLGSIADVQTGPFGSQLHQSDYVQKGTPIITVEHLGDNRINEKDVPKVSDEDKERLKKYTLKEGDIVFSRVGSVDRRSYVRKEEDGWLFSGRCLRVRVEDNNVNPFCLSYFFGLESFKESVRQNAVGATMPSINTQILSNMEITLPPLPVQKKIAKVLGDLDDKIELNRRMNETLEEMAMAVYRHYFINFGLPPSAKEDVTECPFGKLIEHPEMGMIPEGWSVGKLGDVAEILMGQSPPSEFYSEDKIGLPFHQGVTSYQWRFIQNEMYCSKPLKVGKAGSILFSVRAPVGRINITMEAIIIGRGLAALNSNFSSNSLLLYLLKNTFHTEDIFGSGTIFSAITRVEFEKIPVLIANEKIVKKVDIELQRIDSLIKSISQEIQSLTETRDYLLPRLLSGDVRVE